MYFDATFKIVYEPSSTSYSPCLHHSQTQLAFPDVVQDPGALALYTGVFAKVQELVLDFSPTSAMADFEETSAAAFKSVFGDVAISGCWFHFAQSVVKRVNKTGLKDAIINDAHVRDSGTLSRRFAIVNAASDSRCSRRHPS